TSNHAMFCREGFTNGSFGLVPFQRRGEAMRHRTFATLVLLQLVFGRSSAQVSRRAQSLLGQMTLEEKIGQLNLAAGVGLGGFVTAASDTDIIHGRVGAILWLADPKEMNRMQHLAVEKSRLHIPLLFGLDVIHGYRTLFPAPRVMPSPGNPPVRGQPRASPPGEAGGG